MTEETSKICLHGIDLKVAICKDCLRISNAFKVISDSIAINGHGG